MCIVSSQAGIFIMWDEHKLHKSGAAIALMAIAFWYATYLNCIITVEQTNTI